LTEKGVNSVINKSLIVINTRSWLQYGNKYAM